MKKRILISLFSISSILTVNAQWSLTNPIFTNSNVGIGTSTPVSLFSIGSNHGVKLSVGNPAWSRTNLLETGWNAYFGDFIDISVAGSVNNNAFLRMVQNGNVGICTSFPTSLMSLGFQHGVKLSIGNPNWLQPNILETGWSPNFGDFMEIKVAGKSNNNAFLRIIQNGNVGIGTPSPDYKLDVIGNIRAQEIKVNLKDTFFVFEKEYKLLSLDKLETYIIERKHLPGVVPDKEMSENGTDLGKFSLELLCKIEELTLYIIEQNKKLEKQNMLIQKQNEKIKKLEEKIEKEDSTLK